MKWSDDVRLVPQDKLPGKKRKLSKQTPIVESVILNALRRAREDILLRNNWPDEGYAARPTYGKNVTLDACRDMKAAAEFEELEEFEQRMRVDNVFAKGVAELVRLLLLSLMIKYADYTVDHRSHFEPTSPCKGCRCGSNSRL